MCALGFFLSTFLFSLALGPHVMPLRAEESSTSVNGGVTTSTQSPTEGTVPSTEKTTLVITSGRPEDQESNATTETLAVSATEPVVATTVATATLQATSAPMQATSTPETATETTASPVIPTTAHKTTMMATEVASMTPKASADSTSPELTTPVQPQDTTVINKVTTTLPETTQIPSTTASTPAPTPGPTTAPLTAKVTSTPLSHGHDETTPSAVETTPSTMAPTHLTTQHQSTVPVADTHHPVADSSTTDPKASSETTSPTESTVSEGALHSGAGSTVRVEDEGTGRAMWLIIIAVVSILMVAMFCVILIIKCRKKRGAQQFGHGNMNGQSKKKKGADNTWAGPMPLDGGEKGECEGPEEGGQDDHKKPDGTDAVLSTFTATEENGGVGRPGSMEVQKWEEKEPLLYIDEEVKGDGKEGAEKAAEAGQNKEEDPTEKKEMQEPMLNGGEAFCLTTAV